MIFKDSAGNGSIDFPRSKDSQTLEDVTGCGPYLDPSGNTYSMPYNRKVNDDCSYLNNMPMQPLFNGGGYPYPQPVISYRLVP